MGLTVCSAVQHYRSLLGALDSVPTTTKTEKLFRVLIIIVLCHKSLTSGNFRSISFSPSSTEFYFLCICHYVNVICFVFICPYKFSLYEYSWHKGYLIKASSSFLIEIGLLALFLKYLGEPPNTKILH